MDCSLVMFKANGKRHDFPLTKEITVMGRGHGCGLRIPLTSVSREHCQIEIRDDGFYLADLGSSNGTLHNNKRIQETKLDAGDTIMIGPVHFTVVIDGVPGDIEPVKTILDGSSAESSDFTGGTPAAAVGAAASADDSDDDLNFFDDDDDDFAAAPAAAAVADDSDSDNLILDDSDAAAPSPAAAAPSSEDSDEALGALMDDDELSFDPEPTQQSAQKPAPSKPETGDLILDDSDDDLDFLDDDEAPAAAAPAADENPDDMVVIPENQESGVIDEDGTAATQPLAAKAEDSDEFLKLDDDDGDDDDFALPDPAPAPTPAPEKPAKPEAKKDAGGVQVDDDALSALEALAGGEGGDDDEFEIEYDGDDDLGGFVLDDDDD